MKRMDDLFLGEHAEAFHLEIHNVSITDGSTGMPLYSIDGIKVGTLTYSPPTPSKEFLTKVITPILLLATILSLIFFLVFRELRQISNLNNEIKTDRNKLKINNEILKGIHEAVVITDSRGNIKEANDSHCQLMGYSREEILGKNTRLFKSGRHNDEFYQQMWNDLMTKGHWEGEVYDKRKSGEIFPKWLSISVVEDESKEKNYIGIFSDISELKEQEKRLKQIAHFDSLTQLPNRLLFQERVEQKLLYANRRGGGLVALFFIDIDNFKHVNDSLGHSIGDQLLIEIANRITKSLRMSDTVGRIYSDDDDQILVVARIGGDEFTVALDGMHDVKEITPIITRLQTSLCKSILFDGQEVFPSASVGISVFPHDGDDYNSLMKHADTAMYCSKKSGRNLFHFFSKEMNTVASKRIELESGLRKALKNENFILHYQPKMDVAENRIHGVEALIRWNDPELGVIPPSDFIPIAEETDLILKIGEWVLETACKQVAEWNRTSNSNIQLAVNLSARQFKDPDLLSKIIVALYRSGLQPNKLEIEVTETVMIDDIDHAIHTLQALRDKGVSIAIDDFGTGYSSLSYLKQLPVDTLKLDRSFTSVIHDNSRVAAITESIIHMGQKLSLMIVAEGVETEQQSKQLLEYGCKYQQGFLHARPLPTESVIDFIHSYQKENSKSYEK